MHLTCRLSQSLERIETADAFFDQILHRKRIFGKDMRNDDKKSLPKRESAVNKASTFNIHLTIPMADASIVEKVKNIIVEELGVQEEQVTPEARFTEDLGADSLDVVELVMAIEDEFSITVSDDDTEKLQSVESVINYIEEQLKKQAE